MNRLKYSIGRYQSIIDYCNRNHTNNWELYNTLKTKPILVIAYTRLPLEFFFPLCIFFT